MSKKLSPSQRAHVLRVLGTLSTATGSSASTRQGSNSVQALGARQREEKRGACQARGAALSQQGLARLAGLGVQAPRGCQPLLPFLPTSHPAHGSGGAGVLTPVLALPTLLRPGPQTSGRINSHPHGRSGRASGDSFPGLRGLPRPAMSRPYTRAWWSGCPSHSTLIPCPHPRAHFLGPGRGSLPGVSTLPWGSPPWIQQGHTLGPLSASCVRVKDPSSPHPGLSELALGPQLGPRPLYVFGMNSRRMRHLVDWRKREGAAGPTSLSPQSPRRRHIAPWMGEGAQRERPDCIFRVTCTHPEEREVPPAHSP